MVGRPINEDRQNAIALGLKTYTGMRHSRCGTTERYVAGGGCVHCGRLIATEQREARIYLKKMQQQNVEDRDEDLLDSAERDGLDDPEADARFEEPDDEEARRARFEESIDDLM